ncbi:MAG: DUF819 family protein [Clostridia bacterium]|nr:DUF819 family protein [Clostridia bacterium]
MSDLFTGGFIGVGLVVLQIAVIFFLPQVFVVLAKKNKVIKFLSPIVLCYLTGIVLSNIPFLGWNSVVSENIYSISVPIAIALILFSADIVKWLHLAKDTIKSFLLVIISALVISLTMGMLFADKLPEGWKVAGMLTGCYTGGTPNLNAIGQSLEMTKDNIGIVNMSDMLCGGLYFILLGSVVVKLYRKILPKFDESKVVSSEDVHIPALEPIFEDGLKKGWLHIGFAFLIAVLVTGVSVGLALLITGEINMLVLILSVTTFSIALSFWPKLRNTKGTAAMGQYAVYIFSIAIGATVDIDLFFKSSPVFLAFTASVMFGAIILHLILCKIFKIDADTAIITSTAGVYGPAFIAPVAEAMNNRHVILSGLITGIFGYAVGTYLGISIAYIIKSLFY